MAARWMWRCQASMTQPVKSHTSSPVATQRRLPERQPGQGQAAGEPARDEPQARWAAPAVVSPTRARWLPSSR